MTQVIASVNRGHIIGGSAIATMLIAVYAPAGTTVVLVATSVTVLVISHVQRGTWSTPSPWLIAVLGAVILWGVVSSAWSIEPVDTATRSLRVAAVFAAGFVLIGGTGRLSDQEMMSFRRMLVAATVLGILALAVEIVSGMAVLRFLRDVVGRPAPEPEFFPVFNRAATVLALLVWPTLLLLLRSRRWVYSGLLFASSLVVLGGLHSSAAILGIAAGAVVFTLAYYWTAAARYLLLGGMFVAIALAPVLPQTVLKPDYILTKAPWLPLSAHHRLQIWAFTSEAVLERPILGWGMDTTRSLPGGKAQVVITRPPAQGEATGAGATSASEPPLVGELLPLHPHNAALQVWLELGAVGAVLAMAFVVLTVSRVGRLSGQKVDRAAALGFISAAFVIAYFSYGIWQTWWLAALWLCTAFTLASLHGDTADWGPVDRRRVKAASS